MRVLIAGCGYLGLALGRFLVEAGHTVAGIRRSGSDFAPLVLAGIEPLAVNLTAAGEVSKLPTNWDAVIQSAAPDTTALEAYQSAYLSITQRLLDHFRASPLRAFVFTGSTSVYGQTDGSRVTEDSPAEPATATGRILRETEDLLGHAACNGFSAIRLRVAGIYGPKRNRIDSLLRGESRLTGDGARWVNLIHRDDLVRAIDAVIQRGVPGEIYNVADDAPGREREFVPWLCAQLGVPTPVSPPQDANPPRLRPFTDKRVVADKLRRELGWVPQFPSYREGYAPLIQAWREEQLSEV